MTEETSPTVGVIERRDWTPPELKQLAAHSIEAMSGLGIDTQGSDVS